MGKMRTESKFSYVPEDKFIEAVYKYDDVLNITISNDEEGYSGERSVVYSDHMPEDVNFDGAPSKNSLSNKETIKRSSSEKDTQCTSSCKRDNQFKIGLETILGINDHTKHYGPNYEDILGKDFQFIPLYTNDVERTMGMNNNNYDQSRIDKAYAELLQNPTQSFRRRISIKDRLGPKVTEENIQQDHLSTVPNTDATTDDAQYLWVSSAGINKRCGGIQNSWKEYKQRVAKLRQTGVHSSQIIGLDKPLDKSNLGFRMLKKMGWQEKGLGKEEQGIQEPIKPSINLVQRAGIGFEKPLKIESTLKESARKKKELKTIKKANKLSRKTRQCSNSENELITESKQVAMCSDMEKEIKMVGVITLNDYIESQTRKMSRHDRLALENKIVRKMSAALGAYLQANNGIVPDSLTFEINNCIVTCVEQPFQEICPGQPIVLYKKYNFEYENDEKYVQLLDKGVFAKCSINYHKSQYCKGHFCCIIRGRMKTLAFGGGQSPSEALYSAAKRAVNLAQRTCYTVEEKCAFYCEFYVDSCGHLRRNKSGQTSASVRPADSAEFVNNCVSSLTEFSRKQSLYDVGFQVALDNELKAKIQKSVKNLRLEVVLGKKQGEPLIFRRRFKTQDFLKLLLDCDGENKKFKLILPTNVSLESDQNVGKQMNNNFEATQSSESLKTERIPEETKVDEKVATSEVIKNQQSLELSDGEIVDDSMDTASNYGEESGDLTLKAGEEVSSAAPLTGEYGSATNIVEKEMEDSISVENIRSSTPSPFEIHVSPEIQKEISSACKDKYYQSPLLRKDTSQNIERETGSLKRPDYFDFSRTNTSETACQRIKTEPAPASCECNFEFSPPCSRLAEYVAKIRATRALQQVTPEEQVSKKIKLAPSFNFKLGQNSSEHIFQSERSNADPSYPSQYKENRMNVFPVRVKQEKSDRPSSDAETKRKIILQIMSADFPSTLLSDEQIGSVQEALLTRILEMKEDAVKPKYVGSESKIGCLLLSCHDQTTADWTAKQVSQLNLWPGIYLSAQQLQDSTEYIKVLGIFPNSAQDSTETILRLLNNQNENVNVRQWKVLTRQNGKPHVRLEIMADQASEQLFTKGYCTLAYKFGQIQLQLQEPASSCEKRNAKNYQT